MQVLLANEDVTKDGYAKGKPSHLYDDKPILKTILPKTENGEDGLYNNGYIYWLASPSSSYTFHVCDVHYGKCLSSNGYNLDATLIGVRPLVSIPISNVQINNGIVKIVNN